MSLSNEERELLRRICESDQPVAMSDYFHDIHPPNFPRIAADDDPRREAWAELQISLFGASIKLHELGLVEIVHPANGERPDLVTVTKAGRTALA